MELDEGVNSSGRLYSDSTAQLHGYDPHKAMNMKEIVVMVASHGKLKQWNDAAEMALDADKNHADSVLIQNVRNTAAVIALSGHNLSSQNFQLMRAMNISDRTLSKSELASGFAEGALYSAAAPIRAMVDMLQPSDMRLDHAVKRSEDLESSIMRLGDQVVDVVSATAHTAQSLWERDLLAITVADAVPKAWEHYQQSLDEVSKTIAGNLSASDADRALGFSFGVATVGMIRNVMTVGGRKARDFSALMQFESAGNSGKVSIVTYKPGEGHSIVGHVVNGTLRYRIEKSNGELWGHGSEMLASMVDKFKQNGIEIERIQGAMMTEGPESSIGRQFLKAIEEGYTAEEAAFQTLTGQQAKAMGMKHVIVPPMAPVDKSLHPLFTKEPPAQRRDDKHSSLEPDLRRGMIIGHLKTLGLSADIEQSLIAHVEKNFNAVSHEDSISV